MQTIASAQPNPERSEQAEDLFAKLIDLLTDVAGIGADITIKLHHPVPTVLMEAVREAVEAPGLRFTGPLAEVIGTSGTATVSVIAEVIS
ncbi:hypothetical protein ACIG3E_11400 [Streptomyces sp. NPDC053474]|uniref:hypothetical protein n=1 Tax=Streptomyces sp. NPDC053474 TaxID=3365704 RepID=UPI0037D18700